MSEAAVLGGCLVIAIALLAVYLTVSAFPRFVAWTMGLWIGGSALFCVARFFIETWEIATK